MLERTVAAFDIETIPDPDLGRRLLRLEGDDAAVIQAMVKLRREETNGATDYPQLPWHRVVSVCVTTLDPQSGRVEVRSLGADLLDERSHVEGFFRFTAEGERPPRLVSWNGGGFDLPVLRYRAMMLGIAAPDFYRDDDERRWNNYQNRYHNLHVDLMDVLSGYGASGRVGLGTLCTVLGLPDKSFLDGQVYEHVLAGDDVRVDAYCKLDTVATMLLFLAWAFHTGHLPREQVRAHVDALCVELERLEYPGWREIVPAVRQWPPWARSR